MKAPLGVPMFLFSTKVFGGLELGLLLSCQVFWVDIEILAKCHPKPLMPCPAQVRIPRIPFISVSHPPANRCLI